MVIVLGNNAYSLTSLSGGKKLLVLGKQYFEWTKDTEGIEHLTRVRPVSAPKRPRRKGNYWLFNVIYKPHFTKGIHLCMVVAPGEWKAYLLFPGLPEKFGDTCTITATNELIAYPNSNRHTIATDA